MSLINLSENNQISYKRLLTKYYADRLKQLNHENLKREATKGATDPRPLLILFHLFSEHNCLAHWLQMFYDLAGKYSERIDFIAADIYSAEIFNTTNSLLYLPKWHLSASSAPLIYAVDSAKCVHYFNESATLDVLINYCEKLLNRALITLPEPARDLLHAVNIENFDEVLYMDMDTDILLCFHQDHGAHNELLNLLKSVAHRLRYEHLKIMHMYARNLCEVSRKFEVTNLPTIYFVRAMEKHKPITFQQTEFTLKNIIDFIAKHSTLELKYFDRQGYIKKDAVVYQDIRQYFGCV